MNGISVPINTLVSFVNEKATSPRRAGRCSGLENGTSWCQVSAFALI